MDVARFRIAKRARALAVLAALSLYGCSGAGAVADEPALQQPNPRHATEESPRSEALPGSAQEPARQAPPADGPGALPRLENPAVVAAALDSAYPERFARAGIGGVARIRALIDSTGRPDSVRLVSSTGFPWLDHAAAEALERGRFSLGEGAGRRGGLWVEVPLQVGHRERRLARELEVMQRDEARAFGEDNYPSSLSGSKRGVNVTLAFIVDGTGHVVEGEVLENGCVVAAATTAAAMAGRLAFEARTGDPDDRFLSVGTFTFLGDSVRIRMRGDSASEARSAGSPGAGPDDDERGAEADRTRPPRLRNEGRVRRTLIEEYPAYLREAGKGGTVRVWMRVDEEGEVQERIVRRSSGICDFDEAALEVVDVMRYEPARLKGEPEAVWVSLDIKFEIRR